jgi:hypothetical protein
MSKIVSFGKHVGSTLGHIGLQQHVLPVKVDAPKDKKKEEAKAKEQMVRNDKVVLLFVFQVGWGLGVPFKQGPQQLGTVLWGSYLCVALAAVQPPPGHRLLVAHTQVCFAVILLGFRTIQTSQEATPDKVSMLDLCSWSASPPPKHTLRSVQGLARRLAPLNYSAPPPFAAPLQILPMVWAAYNAIPALIFFVYIFAVNPFDDIGLELSCFWLRLLSTLLGIGALACLWFADPKLNDQGDIARVDWNVRGNVTFG